jgi:uncharacterized membrane protein
MFKILLGGILLLNASVWLRDAAPWPTAFISFVCLFLIPGLLLLPVIGIKRDETAQYLYYAVALSIVYLMTMGLVANTFLPAFGINQPLRIDRMLPLLDAGFLILLALWKKVEAFSWKVIKPTAHDLMLASFPLLWVACAAAGAHALNNGGPNGLTIIALLGVLLTFVYDFFQANKLPKDIIAFHIFTCALAMLFMTSLRGWLVTGHDIQREFYVFQLAKADWHWSIAAFRDPYNACLSITILPTMLSGLMHISDSYIYKTLFQILFALTPVAVYLLTKRLANRRLAILAVFYFVAFPTFFMDMPMLTRQEIAFLFFAGMLLLIKDVKQRYRARLILFVLFGAGITLAHYSTTYSMLLIFGAATAVCMLFERAWVAREVKRLFRFVRRSAPEFLGEKRRQSLVVFPVIVVLTLMALFWNVQVTGTSKGFSDTFKNAIGSISGNIDKDLKSTDTQVSLLGGTKSGLDEKVDAYALGQNETRRHIKDQDTYYPLSETSKYRISAAPEKALEPTWLGKRLNADGLNLYTLHYALRQGSAKLLQVLIIVGIFVLFLSKRHKFQLGPELTALSLTSMLFLLVLVLVPVLSLNYGLLRAFQQVLILLALPTVLGSAILLVRFPDKIGSTFALIIAAGFYLSTTGVLAELTGGYLAQLHLHNQGLYYDSYYIHEGEVRAINWLDTHRPEGKQAVLQTDMAPDRFAISRLGTVTNYQVVSGIYPSLVQKKAYVFIGYTSARKGVAYVLHNGEGITYYYPVEFLDNNKNLIYSSGQAKIYK